MLNYSETNFIYLLPSKNPAVKPVRLLIFVVIFFAVRLTNLTLLPPYIDELLHISRAFTLLHQRQLFISTEGGKFLQIWLIAPALALGGDPLWTARLVTILIGLLSTLGCYLLGKALFNRETGLLAAWLYLLVPYALFLDRLVLNDSLLAMLGVYILLFSLKLVGQASLGLALGLGLSLGLAVLTKLNGSIWWVIPVGVLLARLSRLPKSWAYFGGAYLLAFVVVSPLFSLLPQQLAAPAEKTWLLAAPLPASLTAMWWGNIQQTWLYYQTYLTWPIGVLILFGVILSLYRRPQSGLLLLGGAFIYNAFFILVGDTIYSRYLFPPIPFLLVVGGYAAITLKDWLRRLADTIHWAGCSHRATVFIIQVGLIAWLAQPALIFDYQLLFQPAQAPFEASDQWLFVKSSLSGYNLDQVSVFLKEQAGRRGPIIVVRHDAPGLTREGLDLTLAEVKESIQLMTFNFYTISPQLLTQLLQAEKRPVFVVLNLPPVPGTAPFTINFANTPYCHQVAFFLKPQSVNNITIYECRHFDPTDS